MPTNTYILNLLNNKFDFLLTDRKLAQKAFAFMSNSVRYVVHNALDALGKELFWKIITKIITSYTIFVDKFGYGVNNLLIACITAKLKSFNISFGYKQFIEKMAEQIELFSTN